MEIKTYLCRYHDMKKKIISCELLAEEYDRLAMTIPGPAYGKDVIHGPNVNTSAPFEKWVLKKLDVDLEIEELRRQLPIVREETIDLISTLENKDWQRILIYRYLDWLTWEEISSKLYCSTRTIRRWHEEAIKALEESCPPMSSDVH